MSPLETPSKIRELPIAIITSMIGLSTSGFGVVVALAWNEFIKKSVENYVDPYLGKGSGVASLFIYAAVMTVLSVVVTMQLTSLQKKLENVRDKEKELEEKRKNSRKK